LGLGRFWHFGAALGWLLTGIVYVISLASSEQWQRLVPTSWDIFPKALSAALAYFRLDLPSPGHPYNALQQLTYFAIVFVLAPLQIATGIAMSPALAGRFPWFPPLFGGRQAARSVHFLGLVAFMAFTVHHVALVIAHGLLDGLAAIALGIGAGATAAQQAVAVAVSGVFLIGLAALHVFATRRSLVAPRAVQNALQKIIDPVQARLLQPLGSRQNYSREDVTTNPRPNGRPPGNTTYIDLVEHGFDGWRFEVGGMVEQCLSFTLDQLRELPSAQQVTEHKCIQGWSYVAAWQGVPLEVLLERCRPTPDARYILFRTFDEKWEEPGHGDYYCVIDLDLARAPQTLLAYEMNAQPLPTAFGAPLRLRLEGQLGYKMVKWIRSMELIGSYDNIGLGYGGWRADRLHYSRLAPI
jgi:methionine sulfoxide reductase catalytic subunit